MNPEEEFEFDLDEDEDEEEEEEKVKPKKKSSKGTKKGSGGSKKKIEKKTPEKIQKAKRMPLSEGVKRRLLQNIKEINRLKDDLENCTDEKESFEKEFEILEDELENLRSDKDRIEGELNQKVAVVNALEKKLDRSHKDFDNLKKRNASDIERQVKMGSKKLILGIIDVIDNFDRALAEAERNSWRSSVKQLVEGIGSIKKGLLKVLAENGVEVIDPIGEAFDPQYHEAIDIVEDLSKPENTVVFVDVNGYTLDGFVLRPAKVKVSKGGKPRPKKKVKDEKKRDDDLEPKEAPIPPDDDDEGSEDEEKEEDLEEVEEGDIEELDELMDEMEKLDS